MVTGNCGTSPAPLAPDTPTPQPISRAVPVVLHHKVTGQASAMALAGDDRQAPTAASEDDLPVADVVPLSELEADLPEVRHLAHAEALVQGDAGRVG